MPRLASLLSLPTGWHLDQEISDSARSFLQQLGACAGRRRILDSTFVLQVCSEILDRMEDSSYKAELNTWASGTGIEEVRIEKEWRDSINQLTEIARDCSSIEVSGDCPPKTYSTGYTI
jgi:hypothetical protein